MNPWHKLIILPACLLIASAIFSLESHALPSTAEIVEQVYQHSIKEKDREAEKGNYSFKEVTYITEKDNDGKITKQTRYDYEVYANSNKEQNKQLLAAFKFDEGQWLDITEQAKNELKKQKRKTLSQSFSLVDLVSPENRNNYKFMFVGKELIKGKEAYQLKAIPLKQDEKIISGDFWFETEEYALIKANMIPAKLPSQVKEIECCLELAKFNGFWMPAQVNVDAQISFLFFFNGNINIQTSYYDYQFNQNINSIKNKGEKNEK